MLDCEPSLIFDILRATLDQPVAEEAAEPTVEHAPESTVEPAPEPPVEPEPAPEPPPPQTPDWCVCRNCRNMPTLLENKCCDQPPQYCISRLPHMDLYILNAGNLRLARRVWNDLRAEVDAIEEGETNRQFRHAAYRNFVVWQYGILGPGNRVVIPSCCVTKVREVYPDPNGIYVGFIPVRV